MRSRTVTIACVTSHAASAGVMMLHWRVFPRNRLQIARHDRSVCVRVRLARSSEKMAKMKPVPFKPSLPDLKAEHEDATAEQLWQRIVKENASDEEIEFLFLDAVIDDEDLGVQILNRFFKDIRKRLSN